MALKLSMHLFIYKKKHSLYCAVYLMTSLYDKSDMVCDCSSLTHCLLVLTLFKFLVANAKWTFPAATVHRGIFVAKQSRDTVLCLSGWLVLTAIIRQNGAFSILFFRCTTGSLRKNWWKQILTTSHYNCLKYLYKAAIFLHFSIWILQLHF